VHRGLRLQEAEALTGHARFALNALEQTYVDACSALREREQAAEEAQRQRELEAARQLAAEAEARRDAEEQARREAEQRAEEQASATRRLRRRAIGLLVLLAIATGSGIFAYQNARTATRTLVDADFLQATEKIEQQQADKALAYLARAVRTSSQDRAAAERIFSLLADRRFLLPASAPATLPGRITAIRFTPDDRWLVAVINGSTAQVFDARSGKSVTTLLEHDGRPVQMAQISPDGKLLATACGVSETLSEAAIWPQWRSRPYAEMAEANGYGHVWDIATSQPVTPRLEHEKAVLDIHFDTAGTRVATASDDQSVRVWDVASGQPVTPPLKHEAPVTSVRFSPDDTRLAAVAEHLQIWDIASAQLIGSSPTPAVVAAEYSPDGQRIAAVFGHDDQQLVLLNASTGLPIGPGSGDVPSITSFGFDRHDNDVLVSYAARHRIKDDTGGVQEMNGDGEAHELDQLSGRPTAAVAIAPDASEVFVAYFDHTVLWTSRYGFEESSVISSFTLPEPPLHIAVSASGKELIVIFGVGGNSVQLWSLETDAQHPELRSLPEPPKLQAVLDSPQEAGAIVDTSPDGKRVLQYNAKDALIVADARTGAPLSGPMHAVGGYEGGGIWTAKFSPNGKLIAIGEGGDFRLGKGFARIWDAATGRPLTDPLAHRLPVTFVAFSADHERLVTIGSYIGPERPGFIQVWDVRRGRPLTDALQNQIHAEFADLSRTHGQLTAVSAEGLAERRDVGFPLERSLPQWLPLLAEVTGGWRLNAQTGVLEPLPDRWQTLVSLRAEFASSRARDPFTRSGAWFLGNSQTRTISPYSELTVRDYVARCIADGGETLLDHAEALTAGNNELLAQIQARRAQ
jgi:WD40 repeat protein